MLRVQKLHPNATIPKRSSDAAAGYDITASETIHIAPKSTVIIPTGIAIAVPEGTYGRIAPRSGLAANYSLDIGAGVIDQDYRGEIKVVVFNHGIYGYTARQGDRIAQLILECIHTPDVLECDSLDSTVRGDNGFGSTGK